MEDENNDNGYSISYLSTQSIDKKVVNAVFREGRLYLNNLQPETIPIKYHI